MRESQMKKIIAVAVATAFVAPVMAADVTLTGAMEMTFASENNGTATATTFQEDSVFTVKATEELANGVTVSADISIDGNGDDDGGSSLTLSGAFGSVDIGETSGAIDAIDDKTDLFNFVDSGTGLTSTDAALLWTLPSMVDGLTLRASFSPDNGDDASISKQELSASGTAATNQLGSITDNVTGVSFTYAAGPVNVNYGVESVGTADHTFVGVNGSFNGLFIAAEAAEIKDGKSQMGVAASYSMGDITLKVANQVVETAAGADESDMTAYGISYSMGALTLFAEAAKEDFSDDEGTYIGASFAF
jgi:outer membrane protein OmpU